MLNELLTGPLYASSQHQQRESLTCRSAPARMEDSSSFLYILMTPSPMEGDGRPTVGQLYTTMGPLKERPRLMKAA